MAGFVQIKKLGFRLSRIVLFSLMGFALFLLLMEQSLVYHPRAYGKTWPAALPREALEIDYETGQGFQRSFFIPPRNKEKKVPERIWILFGGNASKALDWSYFVAASPFENDGFLLIEYPGYGFCTGSPSPKTIEESAETAFAALGRQLHLNPAELQSRLCAAGHSIGCGAALNFAVRYPPRQLILISPFTSLRDMARRMVGSPLCYVVRGNFDNRARIRELAALSSPPRIAIFHGADDELIPSAMGRELSLIAPQIVRFNEIPDAEHNDIVSMAEGRIFTAMRE